MYKDRKWVRYAVVFFCFLFLGGLYLLKTGTNNTDFLQKSYLFEENETSSDLSVCAEEVSSILVFIAGAVNRPGVYEFSEGDRVFDAIKSAGGLTASADPLCVNQAALLSDGEQLIIYEKAAEDEQDLSPGNVSVGKDPRIDINTADKALLMTLPGIGEAKAEAIISYREANGAFSSGEELMNVSGIGEALFSKLKEKIRF